jgi:aspartokinase
MEHRFHGQLTVARHLGAVSLIGAGINDRYDFLQESLALLARNSIEVFSFHTSSFRISLVIKREELKRAVSLLYERFLREGESRVSE